MHTKTLTVGLAVSLATALAIPAGAQAQSEEFFFDLAGYSDRALRVSLMSGRVEVEGYDGDEVLISVSEGPAQDGAPDVDDDGMRILPNGGQNLVVRQDGGQIIVRAGSMDEAALVSVRAPRDVRLSLHSAMDSSISVVDMSGEMEIQNSNGPVEVRGLRSAAVIHAHTDDLTVSVDASELPGPLVLNSWAGDVELTVPATLQANLRWRTNMGDVRTNLDVTDIETVTEREETEDGVRLEGYTTARLNGGGAEVSVTAYTGDITLRRAD